MNIKRYNEQFIEVWRPVVGFEDYYMVSNLGRIKSLHKRYEGLILQPYDEGHGYRMVDLYKDNIRQKCRVHRLVAQAFIPNPDNKPCVDHINTIRSDNRAENLRFVTYKENNNNELTKKNRKERLLHMTAQEMDLIPI